MIIILCICMLGLAQLMVSYGWIAITFSYFPLYFVIFFLSLLSNFSISFFLFFSLMMLLLMLNLPLLPFPFFSLFFVHLLPSSSYTFLLLSSFCTILSLFLSLWILTSMHFIFSLSLNFLQHLLSIPNCVSVETVRSRQRRHIWSVNRNDVMVLPVDSRRLCALIMVDGVIEDDRVFMVRKGNRKQ